MPGVCLSYAQWHLAACSNLSVTRAAGMMHTEETPSVVEFQVTRNHAAEMECQPLSLRSWLWVVYRYECLCLRFDFCCPPILCLCQTPTWILLYSIACSQRLVQNLALKRQREADPAARMPAVVESHQTADATEIVE